MRSKSTPLGDGFVQDLLPLVKDGFVILRSILDAMIERIEEAEKTRDIDVRMDIYSSITEVLEAEIENVEKEDPDAPTSRAKIEVLEAVISTLAKESKELESKKRKKTKRPKKVTID